MARLSLVLVVAALAAAVMSQPGLGQIPLKCCDRDAGEEGTCCECQHGCRGLAIGTACGTEQACWWDDGTCDTGWDSKCCERYGGCSDTNCTGDKACWWYYDDCQPSFDSGCCEELGGCAADTCTGDQGCCFGGGNCQMVPTGCCVALGGTIWGPPCDFRACLEPRSAQDEQVSWLDEDSEAQVCWLDG